MKNFNPSEMLYFEGAARLNQNRKILRYRACLAEVAIVCVNFKGINGELLSYDFCHFLQESVTSLNRFREEIGIEIQRQAGIDWDDKRKRHDRIMKITTSGFSTFQKKSPSIRARLLDSIRSFCEMLLADLHLLNHGICRMRFIAL